MKRLFLEVANDSSKPIKIWIELICELYIIEPNSKAIVYVDIENEAHFDEAAFSISITNDCFVVYEPKIGGYPYVEVNGVRLSPVASGQGLI